jgi:hypothetical protein
MQWWGLLVPIIAIGGCFVLVALGSGLVFVGVWFAVVSFFLRG